MAKTKNNTFRINVLSAAYVLSFYLIMIAGGISAVGYYLFKQPKVHNIGIISFAIILLDFVESYYITRMPFSIKVNDKTLITKNLFRQTNVIDLSKLVSAKVVLIFPVTGRIITIRYFGLLLVDSEGRSAYVSPDSLREYDRYFMCKQLEKYIFTKKVKRDNSLKTRWEMWSSPK